MMQTVNNGGDVLARGGVRAQFHPPNVSKKKYDAATKDFDLERFLGKKSDSDTDSEATGTFGADLTVPQEHKR
jgi:hypothetical protein